MRIRALERDDLDPINQVTIRCNHDSGSWAPTGWVAPHGPWESERDAWAEIIGTERIVGYVACDQERQVVGVVAADIRERELRRLFVDPAVQGRGVGGDLLRIAETELVRAGTGSAHLWTPDASRAIGFYEAHGWGRDGRTDWHRRLALPMIGMSKRLRR